TPSQFLSSSSHSFKELHVPSITQKQKQHKTKQNPKKWHANLLSLLWSSSPSSASPAQPHLPKLPRALLTPLELELNWLQEPKTRLETPRGLMHPPAARMWLKPLWADLVLQQVDLSLLQLPVLPLPSNSLPLLPLPPLQDFSS
ncbi:hypothetical protein Csa_018687, partial [Cucumis sativus]